MGSISSAIPSLSAKPDLSGFKNLKGLPSALNNDQARRLHLRESHL
jgi:hypothetical protein